MNVEPTCVCHLVTRGGCRQGRACPVRECELANEVPLTPEQPFPAPKGKRMKYYRLSSSAVTGRAPRSMADAFGCASNDPVHPMPDANRTVGRRLTDAIRFACGFLSDLVGGFFGR